MAESSHGSDQNADLVALPGSAMRERMPA